MCNITISSAKIGFAFGEYKTLAMWEYPVHVAAIGAMILSNILMFRFYVLSMQENGAAKATVFNFVVNYVASLFFGAVFFSEVITPRLCFGVSMILMGTAIISKC